jgi:hypothetical protein
MLGLPKPKGNDGKSLTVFKPTCEAGDRIQDSRAISLIDGAFAW